MPQILIVTNGALCRNPRPWKEATTLGGAGYDVTVLTLRNHAPSERYDQELLRNAPFRTAALDMLDRSRPGVLARRLRLWAARQAATRLGRPTIHALGPAAALLRRARQIPADLTIVHNEVPHWVGLRLLAAGRRVAADIEDWHSEDLLPEARRGRPVALLRETERALLQRAAYVSTTSHALADALHHRYGGRHPEVIANSFPLQPDPRAGPPGEPPAFLWFSQTLGPGRGLEAFAGAWGRTMRPSRLVLLGQPYAGFDRRLEDAMPPTHRRAVAFRPLVTPADLPRVIAGHDLGLSLEDSQIPSRDLTITNKLLQYLNAGLAVVATSTAGQREVLAHSPEAGQLIDLRDPAAAAAQLDGLLADPALLARRQAAARQLAVESYCWERETPRLLALVAAALETR